MIPVSLNSKNSKIPHRWYVSLSPKCQSISPYNQLLSSCRPLLRQVHCIMSNDFEHYDTKVAPICTAINLEFQISFQSGVWITVLSYRPL